VRRVVGADVLAVPIATACTPAPSTRTASSPAADPAARTSHWSGDRTLSVAAPAVLSTSAVVSGILSTPGVNAPTTPPGRATGQRRRHPTDLALRVASAPVAELRSRLRPPRDRARRRQRAGPCSAGPARRRDRQHRELDQRLPVVALVAAGSSVYSDVVVRRRRARVRVRHLLVGGGRVVVAEVPSTCPFADRPARG
jgi:hypothetical protein